MLNETFRYAVSGWVISSEENRLPHLITQEEIEFLLEKILLIIENGENGENVVDWIIKKTEEDNPKKISSEIIYHLKKVVFLEMKNLIKKETKIKVPKQFLKDNLYFSKKHIYGF